MKKPITFKTKLQAKIYAKFLWLKTELTVKNITNHKYGYMVKYPDMRWTVIQILETSDNNKDIK